MVDVLEIEIELMRILDERCRTVALITNMLFCCLLNPCSDSMVHKGGVAARRYLSRIVLPQRHSNDPDCGVEGSSICICGCQEAVQAIASYCYLMGSIPGALWLDVNLLSAIAISTSHFCWSRDLL